MKTLTTFLKEDRPGNNKKGLISLIDDFNKEYHDFPTSDEYIKEELLSSVNGLEELVENTQTFQDYFAAIAQAITPGYKNYKNITNKNGVLDLCLGGIEQSFELKKEIKEVLRKTRGDSISEEYQESIYESLGYLTNLYIDGLFKHTGWCLRLLQRNHLQIKA